MTEGFSLARCSDHFSKLRLDSPVCRTWVEALTALLSSWLSKDRALGWWLQLHIGLHNKAPVLPDGWIPACIEACLEVYVRRSVEVPRSQGFPRP